ncbi:WecB/TagA/CpsF family glycosyltransferase [Candidatus Gracilibacteria bacterium]|nr:WecB/TagA/CpsF family glycosyltransferase [Candidatus Gracilibacteria bacterium]
MTILEKIYKNNKQKALDDILELYKKKGYGVINYIYFANLIKCGILSGKNIDTNYFKSLKECDFLLPDGIALKMYYEKYFKLKLHNLNGTDFGEFLISSLKPKDINLILYGAKEEVIEKTIIYLKDKYNLDVFYAQNGYSDFDFEKLKNLDKDKINIFLLGLGTPKQEKWALGHIEYLKKYKLLTFSQGGTFDFWAGEEKRAPKIIQDLKLEWMFRFILNPRKNFYKVVNSFYVFYYLYFKK